jgi:hypothetical protein
MQRATLSTRRNTRAILRNGKRDELPLRACARIEADRKKRRPDERMRSPGLRILLIEEHEEEGNFKEAE